MRRARRSSTLHHQQLLTGQCLLTNRQGGRDHMPFLAASHKSNQPFFFLFFPFSFVILSFFLAFSLGGGQEFPSNALSIQGPRPVTPVTRAPPGPLQGRSTSLKPHCEPGAPPSERLGFPADSRRIRRPRASIPPSHSSPSELTALHRSRCSLAQ